MSRAGIATRFQHLPTRHSAHYGRSLSIMMRSSSSSSTSTPVLPCPSSSSIRISPSLSSSHPLDSPRFDIPPALSPPISTAASHIRAGRTVAIPTETVYGLAASSLNPSAVQSIYRIKNRPSDNPLIMHISSLDMLRRLLPPPHAYTISKVYFALIDAFWPGPLTLLFPSPNPPPLPAPQTNAIRMPAHPLALALIDASDSPLSAPSANSSGRPSPTRAQHVVNDLNGAEGLGCILDGGDCGVGVESTVVDGLKWTEDGTGSVDILRPGGLGVEAIAKVVEQVDGGLGRTRILLHGKTWTPNRLSEPEVPANGSASVQQILLPSTPGMKYRHYSPRIPVCLALPSNSFPSPPNGRHTVSPSHLIAFLASQYTRRQPSTSTTSSSSSVTAPAAQTGLRIGLLHFEDSPLYTSIHSSTPTGVDLIYRSLGKDASSAAQVLFSAMLDLEGRMRPNGTDLDAEAAGSISAEDGGSEGGDGVDLIIIEGCTDDGLGLAVMERVRKAVGGGGMAGDVGADDVTKASAGGSGSLASNDGTFWVDVSAGAV